MRFFVFISLLFYAMASMANDPVLMLKLDEAETKIRVIENSVNKPPESLELSVIDEFQEQLLFIKKTANTCADEFEASIQKSASDLEVLGEPSEAEDKVVSSRRQNLSDDMLSDAQKLAGCRLMLLSAKDIQDNISEQRQVILADKLFAQKQHLLANISAILLSPVDAYQAISNFVQDDTLVSFLSERKYVALILLLISFAIAWFLKLWLNKSLQKHAADEQKGYLSQFQLSLLSCLKRYQLSLVVTATISAFYTYQLIVLQTIEFFGLVIFGLFFYTVFNLVIRVAFQPCPPGQQLSSLTPETSLLLARRLRLLSKLLLIGFLMYAALQVHQFPLEITGLVRNIYLFLLVLNLVWAIWLFRPGEATTHIPFFRLILILGFFVCLIADWLGYINLSNFILIGILGSILLWSLTVFIIRIWTDFLDSLDEGRNTWQKNFRRRIGLKDNDFLPGSFWFRMVFAVIIWSVFLIGLMKIWGFPDASLLALRDSLVGGFELGTVKVVPLKFITAILTFAVLLSIIGWFKRRMNKSWLKHSRMDASSKESMISLSGYVGVALATLVGLSIAGVELSNLAIIAGALSVGIGFGLQNIVNNFISGVILLFERPIKTGDWIVVGTTQGYVKKISIRSTQIQTFDRSDVIVPNSELIATQVTNWMFKDKIGRVIVPIGVAYGTNPEQVKDILLSIAHEHASVITQSPIINKPRVLFMAFGDNSLNFELRCFIRSVDDRLSVISDLNFAIEKAFREADISIPFPQRDVHLYRHDDENDAIMVDSLPATNPEPK